MACDPALQSQGLGPDFMNRDFREDEIDLPQFAIERLPGSSSFRKYNWASA
jgi:hypothetical protein